MKPLPLYLSKIPVFQAPHSLPRRFSKPKTTKTRNKGVMRYHKIYLGGAGGERERGREGGGAGGGGRREEKEGGEALK